MKIGWGTGIAMVYTTFALFIVFMAFQSSKLNIDLVTENYYKKELNYQQRIDAIKNTRKLEEPVELHYNADSREIQIDFPGSVGAAVVGKLLLYRPSDAKLDKSLDVALNGAGRWSYDAGELASGLWRMELDWSANSTDYYNEKTVVIP